MYMYIYVCVCENDYPYNLVINIEIVTGYGYANEEASIHANKAIEMYFSMTNIDIIITLPIYSKHS